MISNLNFINLLIALIVIKRMHAYAAGMSPQNGLSIFHGTINKSFYKIFLDLLRLLYGKRMKKCGYEYLSLSLQLLLDVILMPTTEKLVLFLLYEESETSSLLAAIYYTAM